jgi:hypothetical protein
MAARQWSQRQISRTRIFGAVIDVMLQVSDNVNKLNYRMEMNPTIPGSRTLFKSRSEIVRRNNIPLDQ